MFLETLKWVRRGLFAGAADVMETAQTDAGREE
jgi:hypothetical protein